MTCVRYLPVGPLVEYLARRFDGDYDHRRSAPESRTRAGHVPEVALERMGISRRTWQRYASSGLLPSWRADRLAIALGKHPVELWGDEWAAAS